MQFGLTQRELAERLDVLVETIRNWELGYARPRLRNAAKLAENREFAGKFLLAGLPDRLRAARHQLGLTQTELAARIGVGEDAVSRWERGDHKPWPRHRALAEELIQETLTEEDRVALRVRSLRERLGLTQREFAARIGVYCKTVSRWERGRRRPSEESIEKIERLRKESGSHLLTAVPGIK